MGSTGSPTRGLGTWRDITEYYIWLYVSTSLWFLLFMILHYSYKGRPRIELLIWLMTHTKWSGIISGKQNWLENLSGFSLITHGLGMWSASQNTNTESAKRPSSRMDWEYTYFHDTLRGQRSATQNEDPRKDNVPFIRRQLVDKCKLGKTHANRLVMTSKRQGCRSTRGHSIGFLWLSGTGFDLEWKRLTEAARFNDSDSQILEQFLSRVRCSEVAAKTGAC